MSRSSHWPGPFWRERNVVMHEKFLSEGSGTTVLKHETVAETSVQAMLLHETCTHRVLKTHAQVAVDCLLSICQFEADCINVIMPIPILLLCLFSYYAYYILMLILLLCLQACSVHIYKLLSCYAWQACYVYIYIYIYIYIYAHIIFLYMCTYIYTISCSLENAKVFSLCSQYIIMFVLCVCIYIYIYIYT
jgi:hypothetical protein